MVESAKAIAEKGQRSPHIVLNIRNPESASPAPEHINNAESRAIYGGCLYPVNSAAFSGEEGNR